MAAQFPFNDLHSFKDYVGFVRMCAPELFPAREGVGPEDQWTTKLAFRGLRYGLAMAVEEKGPKPAFFRCAELVDKAEGLYQVGDLRGGFSCLSEVKLLLSGIRTK